MDLTSLLLSAQSTDVSIRPRAEEELQNIQNRNLAVFLTALVTELANDAKPAQSRTLAGLILKNILAGRSDESKALLEQQWLNMDQNTKTAVKQQVMQTFSSNEKEARKAAAQVCAAIATIEIPRDQWPTVVPELTRVVETSQNNFHKESALMCLGYICEETPPEKLQQFSSAILNAVVKCMRYGESNDIKHYAAQALLNSVEFISTNFENKDERDYIMRVNCECTQKDNISEAKTRAITMEILGRICQLYYDKLENYMQALFQVTMLAVTNDDQDVGLQGIEFWSTMSEVEQDLMETEPESCKGYVKQALSTLTPLILQCLTKQVQDAEDDEWTIATAAATCLILISTTVGNDVVQAVCQFVSEHLQNANPHFRDAACMAFGCILETQQGAPDEDIMNPFIEQAITPIVALTNDPEEMVRDTAMWTVGRIAQFSPKLVTTKFLQMVLMAAAVTLKSTPKIACKACWTLQNICTYWSELEEEQGDIPETFPLSTQFGPIVQEIINTTNREDANQHNLRASAYEALNQLLSCAAQDCFPYVKDSLLPSLIDRLTKTLEMSHNTGQERQEQSTIQGLLCGALQVITRKLKEDIKPFAHRMMLCFLKVFAGNSSTVQEESLMAVGAIADVLKEQFEEFQEHFQPHLLTALHSKKEHEVCTVAVGVVADIANALGRKLERFCDDIMRALLENLQSAEVNRDVKPAIICCFGDIALSIEGSFEKYLAVVMTVLEQAASTQMPPNADIDIVEYFSTLRENIADAYTGILQGMKSRSEVLEPYAVKVLQFVQANANPENGALFQKCVCVIWDIANVFGAKALPLLNQEWIAKLVSEAARHKDPRIAEDGQRCWEALNNLSKG